MYGKAHNLQDILGLSDKHWTNLPSLLSHFTKVALGSQHDQRD